MPADIRTFNLVDFTGGLNFEPNQFKLTPNEMPDCMNVDITHRGGLSHRKGYSQMAVIPNGQTITDMHPWNLNPTGACIVAADEGSNIWKISGATATLLHAGTTEVTASTGRFGEGTFGSAQFGGSTNAGGFNWHSRRVVAEFDGAFFAAGGEETIELAVDEALVVWDYGMTVTDFNDDLDNPAGGQFPKAQVIAAWQGAMWAGGVSEDTVASAPSLKPNRLRWSHLNYPHDWHSAHYVDIGDDAGGVITALVPDGDRLLVFRDRDIHVVVGSPPEGISVYPLATTAGVCGQHRVAQTPYGVFFWDRGRGVYKIGKGGVEWVFERLQPLLASEQIECGSAVLAWGGDRLYVKVQMDGPQGEPLYRSWLVYDPSVSKDGAWTRHAFTLDPADNGGAELDMPAFFNFNPPDQTPIFVTAVKNAVMQRSTTSYRDRLPGVSKPTNRSWFTTAWLDMGSPGARKRFRRAEILGYGLAEGQHLDLEVFTNFDKFQVARQGEVNLYYPGDGALFGIGVFGQGQFGAGDAAVPVIDRTCPFGRQRAVQLRIVDNAAPSSTRWGIDGMIVKYTPMPIRG